MANYALTDYATPPKNTVKEATELLETQLETIDTAKTIRLVGVERQGDMFVGYAIYDA